jgi:hypothetical protein
MVKGVCALAAPDIGLSRAVIGSRLQLELPRVKWMKIMCFLLQSFFCFVSQLTAESSSLFHDSILDFGKLGFRGVSTSRHLGLKTHVFTVPGLF